jgi:hypothetical protein
MADFIKQPFPIEPSTKLGLSIPVEPNSISSKTLAKNILR